MQITYKQPYDTWRAGYPNKNPQNTFQMSYKVALDTWPAEMQIKAHGIPSNDINPKDAWSNSKTHCLYD